MFDVLSFGVETDYQLQIRYWKRLLRSSISVVSGVSGGKYTHTRTMFFYPPLVKTYQHVSMSEIDGSARGSTVDCSPLPMVAARLTDIFPM